MYAVLETGRKNNIASRRGDTLEIERPRKPRRANRSRLNRVLLVNRDGRLAVGTPTVSGPTVEADVVEHIRGDKKLTFKMKRRKGYPQNHRDTARN